MIIWFYNTFNVYIDTLLIVLIIYLYNENKAHRELYQQAKNDGLAIASKRNEAEKEMNNIEKYFKSAVRYIRKINK